MLALELAGFRQELVDVIDTVTTTLDTNDIIVFFELFDVDKAGELAIWTGENSLVLFVEIDFVDRHFFCIAVATRYLCGHGVALPPVDPWFEEGRAPERGNDARSPGA